MPSADCGCASNACPSPPTSSQTGRTAYCPTWVTTLLGAVSGKLMIIKNGCIHYLRSCKSGMIYYNGETEEISVGDAPYVSNVPRETRFGKLAKVVTTTRKKPTTDECSECTEEAVQELGSQVMNLRNDGQLVVANQPQQGELPACTPDGELETRLDYLDPSDYDGCDPYGFLIGVRGEKRIGRTTVSTMFWHLLKKLKLRSSMLAPIPSTSAAGGKKLLAFPTSGGTDTDPCYQIKMVEGSPSDTLPENAVKCDGVVNDGTGWKAFRHGHWPFIINPPMPDLGTGATWFKAATMSSAEDVALDGKPTSPCGGKIFAILELVCNADTGASSSATSVTLEVNAVRYIANLSAAQRAHRMIWLDVTNDDKIQVKLTRLSGTGAVSGAVNIIGYAA